MSQMKLGRTEYNYNLIPAITVGSVNPFWLLGFIEGEGTFGLKNLTPYFQIGQHIRSSMVINTIASYLESLPKSLRFSLSSTKPKVIKTFNKRTSVLVISIVNIDALYDYLLFFLLNMPGVSHSKHVSRRFFTLVNSTSFSQIRILLSI